MNDASALHILLVDGRPDPVLSAHLASKDPRMVVSGDGHEALSLILRAKATAPFNLVISALSLPGLDGLTLFRDLRRRQEPVKLAFVLRPAELTPDLRHTCLKLECLPSLLRPVNPQAVNELLASAQRGKTVGPKEDAEPFFGTTTQRFRARGVSSAQESRSPGEQDALVAAAQVPPPIPSSKFQVDVPGLPPIPGLNPPPPSVASLSPIHAPSVPPLPEEVTPAAALPVVAPARTGPPDDYSPASVPVLPEVPEPLPPKPVSARYSAPPVEPAQALDATSVTAPQVQQTESERIRRSDELFPETEPPAPPTPPQPVTGTSRLRRTITGTQRVERPGTPGGQPLSAKVTRRVACAYCDQAFVVPMKTEPFTIPCLHCGQVNMIQP